MSSFPFPSSFLLFPSIPIVIHHYEDECGREGPPRQDTIGSLPACALSCPLALSTLSLLSSYPTTPRPPSHYRPPTPIFPLQHPVCPVLFHSSSSLSYHSPLLPLPSPPTPSASSSLLLLHPRLFSCNCPSLTFFLQLRPTTASFPLLLHLYSPPPRLLRSPLLNILLVTAADGEGGPSPQVSSIIFTFHPLFNIFVIS